METCSKCNGKVFYKRTYSGESLCSACFRDSIIEKTKRTISKYGMIRRGERLGVAVSGGKDSLALLNVLHRLSSNLGVQLTAISVDEGVKGYRDEAIEHAKAVATQLEVGHLTVSYKDLFGFSLDEALDWKDEERTVSSCSFCGVFRRRAIDEAAEKADVSVIATAHNLDDYIQTFMLNLLHGDVARLGWLDPAYSDRSFAIRRVKPFMEIYEEEVALFAYQSGVPFQSVSCPYMHEGLRTEVRDFLNGMEATHPGIKNVLLGTSLDVISHYAESDRKVACHCSGCGRPSSSTLCRVCSMKAAIKQHVNYTG